MDIVTHALMGTVVAAPFAGTHPVGAAALALGSTLPDLDVLSRIFGRRAFLAGHQTLTHSLPVIATAGALGTLIHPEAGLGLLVGLLLHSLTDVTNTYGIMLFAPFSRRRFCLEWVFFIDAFALLITVPAVVAIAVPLLRGNLPSPWVAIIWIAAALTYWSGKALLRRRARTLSPDGTVALLPSALWPFTFFGTSRSDAGVRTFRLDALTGRIDDSENHEPLDEGYRSVLADVPEVAVMRELSPAYHAIETRPDGDGLILHCRDLRTRNFGTRFGDLEIRLDGSGQIRGRKFHV